MVVNLVVMVMIMIIMIIIMISIIMILVARGRIAVWDTGGADGSWLGDLLVGEGVVDKVVIVIIVIITKLMMFKYI